MYGSGNWSLNWSDKRKIEAAEMSIFKTNGRIYTLGQKRRSTDIREQLGIFNIKDKLTQYKINWRDHIQWMNDNKLRKKFKLQTWREKKYKKTTNEIGRRFQGGRNSPRGLSVIVDDDDDLILRNCFTGVLENITLLQIEVFLKWTVLSASAIPKRILHGGDSFVKKW